MTQTVEELPIEVKEKALRIVFVGHVDHGKSTLVGRLLHETDSILPQKMEYVRQLCKERGTRFEYAFILDAFEEEQDQGVTIDVSQVFFKTKKRDYCVIDAPGHKEFLKNMISGASSADAAILMIDAEEGLREQSKRHATILSLLGIKSVIVTVNKMDLVGYDQKVYEKIVTEYKAYLKTLGLDATAFVPISAYVGDNVIEPTSQMKWYDGPTLLGVLDGLEHHQVPETKPFRMPIQDVYRFDKNRIFAGRIESGTVKEGDDLLFLPSGKTAKLKKIERWHAPDNATAVAGESIGFVLDDQIFAERGEIICHADSRPLSSREIKANVFWMGDQHLETGKNYTIKLTTQELPCQIRKVLRVINSSTLDEVSKENHEVAKNEVAELIIECKKDIVFDTFVDIQETGRFVLAEGNRVSGGGIILGEI